MRLIVTGANGFVGRSLLRALGGKYEVVAVDADCAGLPHVGVVDAIEGDFGDASILEAAFSGGFDAVVHLATVPGGAAEADPPVGWRINMDGTAALLDRAGHRSTGARFLFASSIAVIGDPLPSEVDDETPLRPRMLYGAHKAMMEQWIATLTRRAAISGLSLRLPGIVARPRAPSGMKSAFMSEIFHAALLGEDFVSPVSPQATFWLMSADCIARNLRHALEISDPAEPYAITLPAVRSSMAELVAEIAAQAGYDPARVHYAPDAALETGFGRQPPLVARAARQMGFHDDGSVRELVRSAIAHIRQGD